MRKCKNCSYKLMPYDASQCPQCGSREILEISENFELPASNNSPQNTIKSSQTNAPSDLKITIMGQQVEMESTTMSDSNFNCPKCSYPVQSKAEKCPNCSFLLRELKTNQVGTQQLTISLKSIANSDDERSKKRIKLIPLIENDNEINFTVKSSVPTILRRDDIDKDDESLSQAAHIEFSMDEEKFFIKNLASNQAVFKLVKNIEEIKDNDVLLLGKNKYYTIRF